MRVAVVQTSPVFGEKHHNIEQALAQMAAEPADFYVLPELFTTGYNFTSRLEVEELAEPFETGDTFEALSLFSATRNCDIAYGFAEAADGCVYNAAGLICRDGTRGLYRKTHLFYKETLFFTPGNLGFNVFNTPQARVGLMVCFDWYFPESTRTLALNGAQLIAHPSNLVLPHCPDTMPVRSRDNRVFIATANRIGTETRGGETLTFIGQSQLTSARGEILYRAPRDETNVTAIDIEPEQADDKRLNAYNDLFADRQPRFYR